MSSISIIEFSNDVPKNCILRTIYIRPLNLDNSNQLKNVIYHFLYTICYRPNSFGFGTDIDAKNRNAGSSEERRIPNSPPIRERSLRETNNQKNPKYEPAWSKHWDAYKQSAF